MSLLDAQGPGPGSESNPPGNSDSALRKMLPYTSIALLLAALYVAYVFYNRHESDVQAQAHIDQQKDEARQRTLSQVFGNGEIRFNQFTIDSQSLKRGETAKLCYGVENATKVRMDPPVEQLKPTYLHCFDISPKVTTKYTLTAEDGKGHTKSESLELPVH